MSKIIVINLENGMNSYDDPTKVGNRLVNIENLENLTGVLRSKADPTVLDESLTSKLFSDINWFVNSLGVKQYFLYSPSDGKIYITSGTDPYFNTITELVDIDDAKKPDRVDITNWGNDVRFSCGYLEEPKYYSIITNRKFFNNSWIFNGGFFDVKAFPRKPITWVYYDHNTDGISGEVQSGGSIAVGKSCFYKILPIFDGLQEAELDDTYYGPLVTSSGNQSCKIELDVDKSVGDWNPRITGCKIYRATTDSEVPKKEQYRNIRTLSFISESVSSWITSSEAYLGRKLFAGSSGSDYSGGGEPYPLVGSGSSYYKTGTEFHSSSGSLTHTVQRTPNSKFLWSNANWFSDDHWGNYVDTGYQYIFTKSSPSVANGGFDTGSTSWTLATNHVSWSSSNGGSLQCSEHSLNFNQMICKQTFNISPGSNHLKIRTDWYKPNAVYSEGVNPIVKDGVTGEVLYTGAKSYAGEYTNVDTWTAENVCNDGSTNRTSLTIEIHGQVDLDSQSQDSCYLRDVGVWEYRARKRTGYSHQSLVAIDNCGITDNSAVGKTLQVGGSDYFVTHNFNDFFRVSGNAGWISGNSTSGNTVSGGDIVYSNPSGNTYRMTFVDVGEQEGDYHPYAGVNSIDTRFKYSTTLNGRQFVGNVTIYDGMSATGEEHNDMVVFSELNAPDVLPVSNFIKIKDLQGGQIYGIEGLFSDIVVFSERGIFRLNVPSDDPTAWSLVESEPNIGCTHPDSIAKWEGGVFFRGTDNLYYITSNFEFIPVGNDIKDKWDDNLVRCKIDVKNNRLIVNDTVDSVCYLLDLNKFKKGETYWYKFTTDSTTADGDLVPFVDRDGEYKYLLKSGANTIVKKLSGSSYSNGQIIKTGTIDLKNPLNPNGAIIRRVYIVVGQSVTQTVSCRVLRNNNPALININIPVQNFNATQSETDGGTYETCLKFGGRFKSIAFEFLNLWRIEEIRIEVD